MTIDPVAVRPSALREPSPDPPSVTFTTPAADLLRPLSQAVPEHSAPSALHPM
jgi:hypothetical protein